MMMILLLALAVALVVLGAPMLVSTWRERRTPPELRGDWWRRFEADFRAYATRTADRQSGVD
jgi:cytochrome c oxidase assembly factor CtaG